MFTEDTVFILGAGASWHYGYPVGEDLIKRVSKESQSIRANWDKVAAVPRDIPKFFSHLHTDPRVARSKLLELTNQIADRIEQVNPLVIDYFLQQNPSLQDIGKLFIAAVLLDCEKQFRKVSGNLNHIYKFRYSPYKERNNKAEGFDVKKADDDWMRFIIGKLIDTHAPHDLLGNKVSFITFNYDVSLENRLYRGINPVEFIPDDIKKEFFEKKDLVIHLYGQIRQPAYEDNSFGRMPDQTDFNAKAEYLNIAWEAAQNIYTIPESKTENIKAITIAQKKIREAKRVYILGYGFDERNSELLLLDDILKLKESRKDNKAFEKVFFTNFDNRNIINKKAARVFLGKDNENKFIEHMIPNKLGDRGYYEKSHNNIYDALAYDFPL